MGMSSLSFDLGAISKGTSKPDPQQVYDVLIVGGGPAAMSATVYAARKVMKIALLAQSFGGQMGYTSEIENYIGFQSISGKELVDKFRNHINQFEVPVHEGEKAVEVVKDGEVFLVKLEGGTVYRSHAIILATGKRDRTLGVPGEQKFTGRGVAYCATCDAPFFKDKKVVVVGGGNSALQAALDLLKVKAEVTLVNFVEGWQADEIMMQSAKKHDALKLIDYHQVLEIKGDDKVEGVLIKSRKDDVEKPIEAEGVFIEIGLIPNSELISGDAVMKNSTGELVVDCGCKTSLDGLYGAGDVTTVPYKQIIISAGEGAKAALSAYEDLSKRGLL